MSISPRWRRSACAWKIGLRMHELATRMPGFISYKDFAAADGETVTIVEFESEETVAPDPGR
jgi:hypothetical protein